jgi:hypothetical protein
MTSFRERCAIHESGHCVAALAFGISLVHVTIADEQPHAQCASYRASRTFMQESLVTFFLAGPEAEREFCGVSDDGGDRIDLQNARDYLARHCSPLHIGFELAGYRDAAQRLVRSPWAQRRIRLLAAALLRHGTLSGEEIHRI